MNNIVYKQRSWGELFGWKKVDNFNDAQNAANDGKIVIILDKGHVAVVVAEGKGPKQKAMRNKEGIVIAPLLSQAGLQNFRFGLKGPNWWANRNKQFGIHIWEERRKSPIATPEEMGVR